MTAEFISPEDSRWKNFLSTVRHDFYHLPEYAIIASRHEGGQPCAFLADSGEHGLLIPLLMRCVPESLGSASGFCDVLTPYGYPGPLLSGHPSEKVVSSMLEAFMAAGREKGIVSAFWRLHPLLPFPRESLSPFGRIVQHGRTVYIDLTRPPQDLWKETSNNHRRQIKVLQKEGFVAVRNEWDYWPAFLEIYRDAMNRLEASDFYYFSDAYFKNLRALLGDRIHLWTVLSPRGEVAATALCISEHEFVEYHLGAVAQDFSEISPLKLLIFQVRLWAGEAGYRLMHLGGGMGGSMDSLYSFKSRFSPLSAEFHTFRAILLPSLYDQLTSKRFGPGGPPEDTQNHFFPAYRTPE